MSGHSKILIIYTGGTIGMVKNENGQLNPFEFEHLKEQIPELKSFDYQIDTISFAKPIDSSNMSPKEWVKIGKIIQENYTLYDGFVVLHGTDTMSYTASALSFMLEKNSKPVVLTGSQLPIGLKRTDGKENLITAIEIAGLKDDRGVPQVKEVVIYFEYKLYRGNRTTKVSADQFEAFLSPNYPILAQAGVEISFNENALQNVSTSTAIEVFENIDNRVCLIKLFPGMPTDILSWARKSDHVKAVVLESFGSGNAPLSKEFRQEITSLAKEKPVLNITQCVNGHITAGKYETGAVLSEAGVINGYDLTTEAAVTKMMYALGKNKDKEEIKKIIETPLSGEISTSTIPHNK